MKKYSDYKNSSVPWIGEIPTTWNLSQLRYVIECLDGKRVPVELNLRADMQGNIPYWGAGNIVDYVDKALFDEELVLLGEDGAPFFDHTRPVAFHITEPIWANNHIHVLRIKENADPKYIVYVLNAVDYKEYINGAILNKLTQSAMNRIKIPLPPLSVQKKISKHLDKKVAAINALLTQKESLVTLLQEKRTTTINNAVTRGIKTTAKMYESSVEWLGEVPENWRIVPAKALFATMSLTLERRKETALLRGSNLSYNEGVIGLTGHCLSFHARTGKL